MLYSFDAIENSGHKTSLSKYQGKVSLVVNVASKCGLTPQYKALEAVYEKYEPKGFVVLGFPSNDFAGQEPGTEAEIKKFCELTYNIKFPLFAKGPVKGPDKQPIYKWLTEQSPEKFHGEIEWNFAKFLIGKNGEILARFHPKTTPDSPEVIQAIEAALK